MQNFAKDENKIDLRLKSNPVLSNNRITTFSPYTVGNIETRISISFPGDFIENLPSWGSRFSAIFKLNLEYAKILLWQRVLKIICRAFKNIIKH